jgi:hypothetical protein
MTELWAFSEGPLSAPGCRKPANDGWTNLPPLSDLAVVLAGGSRFSRRSHQIVGEPAQQTRQFHQVFLAPARERLRCQPLARRVQHFGHGLAFFGDDRLGHTAVGLTRVPSDEAQIFELCDLPADRRVVAANPVRQFAHPERPAALDQHQKRKERAVQRYAGLA